MTVPFRWVSTMSLAELHPGSMLTSWLSKVIRWRTWPRSLALLRSSRAVSRY